jgi:hypothetical protein
MIDAINVMLAHVRILACFMSKFVYRLCIETSGSQIRRCAQIAAWSSSDADLRGN